MLHKIEQTLNGHLGQKEDRIIPVMARTWTQQEWDAVGQRAGKQMGKDLTFPQQMLVIRYTLEAHTPEMRDLVWRKLLPAPLQAMWSLFGERRYRAHKRTMYAGAA